ncbi:inactive poly [ADP-ribose] polymerase RCD1-like [Lotus japonicus]|uniref:inactive poly [ADP-ribose] polymerase RCD1-like n=1 Tax=Lotus japonicus TaxID=34305 RepID=UPI0025842704|nr:inactive poly [ADP-ribose] polymerase RCD1-like [Lotus japonicus]
MEARTESKQKQTTYHVAHQKRASRPVIYQQPSPVSPTSKVVKKMRLCDYESKRTKIDPHPEKFFLRYYLNYKRSGRPERIMFYHNDEWFDYPVVDLVKNDFEIKKPVVEIWLNGHDLMLDFLHMCLVDFNTGLQQPLAWIDEVGHCFFPEVYVASYEESSNLCKQEGMELPIEIKMIGVSESKLRNCSRESNALGKGTQVEIENQMNILDSGNRGESILQNQVGFVPYSEYEQGKLNLDSVHKLFLNGMSNVGSTHFEIVETYYCLGASMQARLKLFQTQVEITKIIHKDANVRYAWLPFNKEELSTMMKYGLGHCALCVTKSTYGVGVHLAAVTCPYASARYCDIDENGVRHLALCRVIMGNMEVIHPAFGSDTVQFQPSSPEYDNGVDNIQCPRYYVVWNMNKNTHIHPEFVVSFKVFGDAEGYFREAVGEKNDSSVNSSQANSTSHGSCDLFQSPSLVDNITNYNGLASTLEIPKSPWLPFPMLIATISDTVSPDEMSLILAHYELFKAKQISRDNFVKEMRLIVGDTILRAMITSLQFRIPSNGELEGSNQNDG